MKKLAILVNRSMAEQLFDPRTLDELRSICAFNETFPETVTEAFMREQLADADACITCWGTPRLTDEMLDEASRLRFVMHAAGSLRPILPEGFWARGIRAASNAPVIAEDVAQTVLMMTLYGLKQVRRMSLHAARGGWSEEVGRTVRLRRLDGLTVGVVGASQVGRQVVRLLAPFGCRFKVYDPYLMEMDARRLGVERVSLDELLASCDVVTLHAPGSEATRHMLNADNLPRIQDGAVLINTSRGTLIDETALEAELRKNRFFAYLDVLEQEPPRPDHPFFRMDNVVVTPHIAGGATENGRRMLGENALMNVADYLTKGIIRYEVRGEMMGTMA